MKKVPPLPGIAAERHLFSLEGRVALITGGAGLLGRSHAAAIAMAGGIPVVGDIRTDKAREVAGWVSEKYGVPASAAALDVTDPGSVRQVLGRVLEIHDRIDILINNAANNPKLGASKGRDWSRLEDFALQRWEDDIRVGLTGAFLCSQAVGTEMARRGTGVILNVASDLAVISPDQRLYRREGVPDEEQSVKPVSYPVLKTALVGLTRYLATYWADRGIRVNAISPGGVFDGQAEEFVGRLIDRIPLGRMAHADEYQGAVVFMCSDASSYLTGQNIVMDGGRSCW